MNANDPKRDAEDRDLDQLISEATGTHPAPDLAERIAARHRAAQAMAAQERQMAETEVQDVNDGFNNWWIAAAVALGMAVLSGVAWQQLTGDGGNGHEAIEDQDNQGPVRNLYQPPEGIVHVHSGDELAGLPEDTKAVHCFDFTDRDMAFLARLTELEWLDLSGRTPGFDDVSGGPSLDDVTNSPLLTDAGLVHLGGLSKLRVLILDRCGDLLGEGLAHVAQLTGLQRLSMSRCSIDRQHLMQLGTLTELRSLHLDGNPYAAPESFGFLPTLKKLQFLNLQGCYQIPSETLQQLGELRGLRSLVLGAVCGHFLGQTAVMFDDFGSEPPPEPIRPVMQAGGGEGVNDAVLAAFRNLHRLEALSIDDCGSVTDAGIEHLRDLKMLRELDISSLRQLTPVVAGYLPHTLETIRCGMCPNLDDEFLEQLGLRCPHLKQVNLTRIISQMLRVEHKFTQYGLLALLQQRPGLDLLNLSGNDQIGKTTANEELRKALGGVRILVLDNNNTVVRWLFATHLPNYLPTSGEPPWLIHTVSVRNTDITDKEMNFLGELPLHRLDVRGCKELTPRSVSMFRLLDLEVLGFGNSGWEAATDRIRNHRFWKDLKTDEGAGWNWTVLPPEAR